MGPKPAMLGVYGEAGLDRMPERGAADLARAAGVSFRLPRSRPYPRSMVKFAPVLTSWKWTSATDDQSAMAALKPLCSCAVQFEAASEAEAYLAACPGRRPCAPYLVS